MTYESKYTDDEPLTFDDLKPGDFFRPPQLVIGNYDTPYIKVDDENVFSIKDNRMVKKSSILDKLDQYYLYKRIIIKAVDKIRTIASPENSNEELRQAIETDIDISNVRFVNTIKEVRKGDVFTVVPFEDFEPLKIFIRLDKDHIFMLRGETKGIITPNEFTHVYCREDIKMIAVYRNSKIILIKK